MRKQYHSRETKRGRLIWDVDRLVQLSKDFPRIMVPLDSFLELDESYWFEGKPEPTVRDIVVHVRLVQECDLRYPIILSSDGRVMDGMHRIVKALSLGQRFIEAVKFENDPEPDYVDVDLDDLRYRSSLHSKFVFRSHALSQITSPRIPLVIEFFEQPSSIAT